VSFSATPEFWVSMALAASGGILALVGLCLRRSARKHTLPGEYASLYPLYFRKSADQQSLPEEFSALFPKEFSARKRRSAVGLGLLTMGLVLLATAAIFTSAGYRSWEYRLDKTKNPEGSNAPALPSPVSGGPGKTGSRTLAKDQRERLIKCLKGKVTGPVIALGELTNPEASRYAFQIRSALREAGFQIPTGTRPAIRSIQGSGVWILVGNPTNAPPHAILLEACLNQNGVGIAGWLARDFPGYPQTNIVGIYVGPMP